MFPQDPALSGLLEYAYLLECFEWSFLKHLPHRDTLFALYSTNALQSQLYCKPNQNPFIRFTT